MSLTIPVRCFRKSKLSANDARNIKIIKTLHLVLMAWYK